MNQPFKNEKKINVDTLTDLQNKRFLDLTSVLEYDSYEEKYLSVFDRMFIQKERSAIINNLPYKQDQELEDKIQIKLIYINRYGWKSPYTNHLQ